MKPAYPKNIIEFIHADPHPVRQEVAWYRWEFLRRNPRYRADYQRFIEKHGGWLNAKGYWYEFTHGLATWTLRDEEHFDAKIAPTLHRLCRKWKISDLIPPDWHFDRKKGTHNIPGGAVELPTQVVLWVNGESGSTIALVKLGFMGTADLAKRCGNLVLAEFDLTWPMKDLMEYAKRVLAYAQENYRNELRERGLRIPSGRRRFQDYDTHLRVWDLRQKKKTVSEIAKLVFPVDSAQSALQKVRDHLKAAQGLISGRYAEIR